MMRLFVRILFVALLLQGLLTSCQKEEGVKKPDTDIAADSVSKAGNASAPGNYLASRGTLKIKVEDSTYTFNAEEDSIAFVNVNIEGKEYFGLTAINKAHTVSFGISSPGAPIAEIAGNISGCQFLLHPAGKANVEYTLTHNSPPKDYGTILIDKYNQDTLLAKGSFHTYLARDTSKNASSYIADGSFELAMK